jgi:hypothetical protein
MYTYHLLNHREIVDGHVKHSVGGISAILIISLFPRLTTHAPYDGTPTPRSLAQHSTPPPFPSLVASCMLNYNLYLRLEHSTSRFLDVKFPIDPPELLSYFLALARLTSCPQHRRSSQPGPPTHATRIAQIGRAVGQSTW